MATEQELNDNFVRICGSVGKADRLQQLWNMSYPHYKKTREQDFKEQAKREGFTNRQINAFLSLP